MRSARRASRISPALCKIAARLAADIAPQRCPSFAARPMTRVSAAAVFTVFAVMVFSPRVDFSMRPMIPRAHSRFASIAVSVSVALWNPSVAIGACFFWRFWTRWGAGNFSSRSEREARKRFFSRSNNASFSASSNTADMKFSWLAPSSSRRMRYAMATSNSAGCTTGV